MTNLEHDVDEHPQVLSHTFFNDISSESRQHGGEGSVDQEQEEREGRHRSISLLKSSGRCLLRVISKDRKQDQHLISGDE